MRKRPPGTPPRITCDEVTQDNPNVVGPCHVFRGGLNSGGYGQVSINGVPVGVHRIVYEREVGPIPAGLVVDHMCRNRACCNVDHLRVVTYQVNATENVVGSGPQVNAAKTHCKRGHEFSPENTYRLPRGRECRTCKREANRTYRKGA
jgi:hypothetical protein